MSEASGWGNPEAPPRRKGGWRRAGLAVLAVVLVFIALDLAGVISATHGAVALVEWTIAAVAAWFAYRGKI